MQLVAQCLNKSCKNKRKYVQSRGRDIVAGVAIRYELNGPVLEPRWERSVLSSPYASTTVLNPTYSLLECAWSSYFGGKAAGVTR